MELKEDNLYVKVKDIFKCLDAVDLTEEQKEEIKTKLFDYKQVLLR